MASLILAAGALTYDKVQKSREKKRAAREDHNQLRYSELEKDHAEHLARTESGRGFCCCGRGNWDGKTHMEGCTRARLARNGDEGRDLLMDEGGEGDFWGVEGNGEKSNDGPPSYEISERKWKNMRRIFGRMTKKDERTVR